MPTKPLNYAAEIESARKARERRLIETERSWLTLSGLFTLREGKNTFGSSPENDIHLPGDAVPPQAGAFILKSGKVTAQPIEGLIMTCNEGPLPKRPLRMDTEESTDFLRLANHIMVVIQRADRIFLRTWDAEHPVRKHFAGLRYYPVDPAYRIEADFISYKEPRPLSITDVLGNTFEMPHIGYVTFQLHGQECRLEVLGDEKGIYLSFKDETNGKTTYGGGRELEAELPRGGKVVLDFNLTHNPPCAYTYFATCPLPPAENTLPVAVEAGEMIYQKKLMR
ncbi:MAG: DUF1684 domain-containing protein [Anaerolineales bacterium]